MTYSRTAWGAYQLRDPSRTSMRTSRRGLRFRLNSIGQSGNRCSPCRICTIHLAPRKPRKVFCTSTGTNRQDSLQTRVTSTRWWSLLPCGKRQPKCSWQPRYKSQIVKNHNVHFPPNLRANSAGIKVVLHTTLTAVLDRPFLRTIHTSLNSRKSRTTHIISRRGLTSVQRVTSSLSGMASV